ncbi:MAG: Smr/MutS family protein [bacterium]|nr:Smr/MutS family protein [bacterium]
MSSDDQFFELMRNLGVRPLGKQPPPKARKNTKASLAGPLELTSEPVAPKPRPKYSPKPFRWVSARPAKINRDFEPDDELDLHGERLEDALFKVHRRLMSAEARGLGSLLVITGKGLNSEVEGGVLRRGVWDWLQSGPEEVIASFEEAPSFMGGSGALLIFLYRKQPVKS